MADHSFHFEGGDRLNKMGASWFVSYLFYCTCDQTHLNWQNIGTVSTCKSVFNRTRNFHTGWLNHVLDMNDGNLNKNKLGLDALQIKQMARQLLNRPQG